MSKVRLRRASAGRGAMMRLCSFVVGLAGSCVLSAATYHVSTDGNDLADGLTPETPWASISEVNGATLAAGDVVLFRRGDTWAGTSLRIPAGGAPGQPVRFGAYGEGAKPVLRNADGPGIAIMNLTHVLVEDLSVVEPAGQGVSIEGSEYITVRRVEVRDNGSGPGINAQRGGWIHIDGCVVLNARSNGIQFRGSEPPEIHDSIIENCFVSGTLANDGIVLHAAGSLQAGSNFIFRNNVSNGNAEQGYDVTTGHHVLVENNRSTGNDRGAFDINHFSRYVTVLHHRSENEPTRDTAQTMKIGVSDVTVAYSQFLGPIGVNKPIIKIQQNDARLDDQQPENVSLHNNLFVWQHAESGPMIQLLSGISKTLTIDNLSLRNNILTSTTAARGTVSFAEPSRPPDHPGFVLDHNLYHAPGGARWVVANQVYDFDAYRDAFGQDAHSLEADPQFTDVAAGDFTLLASSPAIDAGAELGLTLDLAGVPVPQGDAPDIGAYEFSLAPAAPAELMATAVSPYQVDLVWTDHATDETAFRIQRRSGAGEAYADTVPASVGANTVTFSDVVGVADNTTYFYQVRAENAWGASAWSNEATATTPEADTTPPVFLALSATPDHLWPPNHQMVAVSIIADVTDDRDSAPTTRIVSVTSSEPDGGESDFVVTGDLTLSLRAERDGEGAGRLYTVAIESTDASGNSATAVAVISVGHSNGGPAPTVALTAPGAGAVLRGTVTLAAHATDNEGVVGVRFILNGSNLGLEDVSSPYGVTWDTSTVPDGNYVLTAVARDRNGNSTTSAPVSIRVDNAAPSVVITAPTEGALLSGQGIPIAATASDNHAVAGVLFKLDGVALTIEDKTAPYGFRWTSVRATDGSHELTAVARDVAGNTATSAPVMIIVDNLPPSVALTSPTGGAVVGGSNVQLTASATDIVGVAGVQFKANGQNIGAEDTSAPYTAAWDASGLSDGNHVLTAVARDLTGRTAVSAAVSVTVDNTPPAVAITAPTAGSTLEGTVEVGAEATDAASMAGVQFQLNGVNLGAEDSTAPYGIQWSTTTAGNGTHVLTAVARDAAGNTTTSVPVAVTVANAAPLMFEAELLTIAESTDTIAPTDADGASNGRYVLVNTNLAGDYITYTVNVPADGTYLITTGLATQGNRGIFQLLIDEVNQGGPQDYYTPGGVAQFSERDLGTRFLAAGAHSFRFLCTGRHASSGNRKHALDYIKLTPQ